MWQLLKNTFTEFNDDDCPQIAAALAFYTTFSLAPLLVLLLTICGFFLDPADVRGQVANEINHVVGEQGAQQVKQIISSLDQSHGGLRASIISTMLLIAGATGVMGQLQTALNRAWDVPAEQAAGGIRGFLLKRLVSLAMLISIALVMLTSLSVSWFLKAAGDQLAVWLPGAASQTMWIAGHELLLLAFAFLLFTAMFKFLPDAYIRWRDVAVGGALTAFLFVLGKFAIGMYLGSKNTADAYGAAGSLVVILLWLYYSAMILLLGAEFTQVWTRFRGRKLRLKKSRFRSQAAAAK